MEFHKGELSWYIAIEVERNKHRVTRIQWHSVGHRSTLNWPLQPLLCTKLIHQSIPAEMT